MNEIETGFYGFTAALQVVFLSVVQASWNFVYGMVTAPSDTMLSSLRSVFPFLSDELSVIQYYLGTFDYIIEIDVCLQATGGYIGFLTVWTTYKHVKAWIPTVSSS